MGFLDESDELHERVQRFASGTSADGFDELALGIAHFQARYSPGFARLVERRGRGLDGVAAIPAVPSACFRLGRVALHAPDQDAATFFTSGTTLAERGVHALRRLDTYRKLSVEFGRRALASALAPEPLVVALAPRPTEPITSSLHMMMRFFMEHFDGKALAPEQPFAGLAAERWLTSELGVHVDALRRAARLACEQARPLLLLGTAFAFVALLDALGGARLPCPEDSLLMLTGGFKGKSRSVEPAELRRQLAQVFGMNEARIVGEYGMTELTSQLYEGTAPGALLAGPPGVYLSPPWLSVHAVDPETLEPLPAGQVGLACFVDLGNIDSALSVVTEDLVVSSGSGVSLVGRAPKSPARGCSLALESLIVPQAAGAPRGS